MNDDPAPSIESLQAELAECRGELSRMRLLLDVQATIDLATGMLNAQGMLEPIQAAMDRLARLDESFGLCLIEIPGVLGHRVEHRDGAMRHAGALLAATLRGLDRVGRLGEASFLLVLPHVARDTVEVVLDRVSGSIGVLPYETDDGPIDLTPTFTVVLNPDAPVEPESMLDAIAAARATAAPGSPAIVRFDP
jgi:PleD family two-component response regulator